MAVQRGRHYLWLCIALFAVGAWLGSRVAQSAWFSSDLAAYNLLCESTETKNCAEIKIKADEALERANDPELKIFAGMLSDTMKLYLTADIKTVEDHHSLAGILTGLISGVIDRKLSVQAAWLLVKKTWYHDLAQKLDTHYQRLRWLTGFAGGLVCGLAAAGFWLVVAHVFASEAGVTTVPAGRPAGVSRPLSAIDPAADVSERF